MAGAMGASVAHELRNALAVAESALFLARRDLDDRARLERHLDQVGAEIQKAHGVIGSVLGLARGELSRRETAGVGAMIDAARCGLALPPQVDFEVRIDPPDLTLACDPILFERVFANLYANALEVLAGRERGAIVTRAFRGEGRTHVEVEDDGPGIAPAIADCIFEPLVTANKPKGTGLGLALCRTILEAHGGDITVGPGARGGALFRMWVPDA
jgi:signal transduction histidine kinase